MINDLISFFDQIDIRN